MGRNKIIGKYRAKRYKKDIGGEEKDVGDGYGNARG